IEITAVQGTDETTGGVFDPLWQARAASFDEVDMSGVKNMVDNVIHKARGRPISKLTIYAHGGPGYFETSNPEQKAEAVMESDVSVAKIKQPGQITKELLRLRRHFAVDAMVDLRACESGQSEELIKGLAQTFGVPVRAYQEDYSPL